MVLLSLFENTAKNQTLRTLLALAIIIPCDILYLKLSEKSLDRLWKHGFAYFNVWITLAIVFGVSLLSTNSYKVDEVNDDTIKNYAYYGNKMFEKKLQQQAAKYTHLFGNGVFMFSKGTIAVLNSKTQFIGYNGIL